MPEQELRPSETDLLSATNEEILELETLTTKSRHRSERIWFLYALWAIALVAVLLAVIIPVLRTFGRIDQSLREANATSEGLKRNVTELQAKLVKANQDLQKLAETDAAKLQAQANLLSSEIHLLKQNKANINEVEQRFTHLNESIAGKANANEVEQKFTHLNEVVAGKANANEVEQKLTHLNEVVAGKANTNELEQRFTHLNEVIAGKANANELEQRFTHLNEVIAGKANANELEQRFTHLNEAIAGKVTTGYVDSKVRQLSDELHGRFRP